MTLTEGSHLRRAAGLAADFPTRALRLGIEGPEDVRLQLTGGARDSWAPFTLTAPPPANELPPYGRVLLDVLSGGSDLSVRGDEAEQAWRVVAPVLEAWSDNLVPLEERPAGSSGPADQRR